MKKINFYLILILAGFVLYSCASSIPRSDAVHEQWAQKQWKNIHLSEARDAYTANCSGCHMLHSPAEHTQAEWIKLFDEMAWKAHMSAADSIKVIAYLETYSKDNLLQ
jgi:nitrate/TMAO reductase-like tetraheme cytochrome c subunit